MQKITESQWTGLFLGTAVMANNGTIDFERTKELLAQAHDLFYASVEQECGAEFRATLSPNIISSEAKQIAIEQHNLEAEWGHHAPDPD